MQVAILYIVIVLIWGSTWAAIPFQLGTVAEEFSVAYRFGLASLALFGYALLTGRQIRVAYDNYPMVVLQGAVLYSANYLMVYYGTNYITSGLVAVVFSLIVLCNAFFERLFFATPLEPKLLIGAVLGMAGIALIFWPEVTALSIEDRAVAGVLIITAAVVVAALGNMCAVVNTGKNLPVVAVNAHAMGWGAVVSVCVALALGRDMRISLEPAYLWSLLYLSLFGSAIAFGSYLSLIRRIGSARAAYSSLLFPIVALLISTFLEGYRWTAPAIAGIALILAGNFLALMRPKRTQ